LTRADLERFPCRILKQGGGYEPDLCVYSMGDEEIVLKDFSARRGAWRELLGAVLTMREARILRVLKGMEGVPQFRGRPDRYSVAMTYVPGRRVSRRNPAVGNNEGFVRELESIVSEMHRRGVVHLDLKHQSNLLLSSRGRPVVLDFASSLYFNPRWPGGTLVVKLLGHLDWLAVANWKRRLCPGALSPSDRRMARLSLVLRGKVLPRWIADVLLARAKRKCGGGGGRAGPPPKVPQ